SNFDRASFLMQITWRPFAEDGEEDQPWVAAGRGMFGRSLWLHSFQVVEFLPHYLTARTLGLHQPPLDLERLGRPGRRSRQCSGLESIDWADLYKGEVENWRAGGSLVSSDARSSEPYLEQFRAHYRDHLQLGSAPEVLSFFLSPLTF